MKRPGVLTRKTPMPRGSGSLSRSGRPQRKTAMRKRNPKRRVSEFARCYHSRERVRFVKGLACVACVALHPLFVFVKNGERDNAHTVTDGAGRKAGYETIVPLCRSHHRCYDEHRRPFDNDKARDWLKGLAPRIEAMWQSHVARSTPSTAGASTNE